MASMPYFLSADGDRIYNSSDRGHAATSYYRTLLTTTSSPDADDADDPYAISETSLWKKLFETRDDARDLCSSGKDGIQAVARCPRGRTCGRDNLPAEAWHAAIETDGRVLQAITWAFNQRLLHGAHDDDEQRQAPLYITRPHNTGGHGDANSAPAPSATRASEHEDAPRRTDETTAPNGAGAPEHETTCPTRHARRHHDDEAARDSRTTNAEEERRDTRSGSRISTSRCTRAELCEATICGRHFFGNSQSCHP